MTAAGIEGRVAIVTGTSSGLGRRFAQVLDEAGARLVLASRRHGEDLDLAAQLRDAWPAACDVRVAADREALVSAAVEHFGQVDILVNNAGVAYSGPAEDESAEHWQDLIDTNLTGLFVLTQLVGPCPRRTPAAGIGALSEPVAQSAVLVTRNTGSSPRRISAASSAFQCQPSGGQRMMKARARAVQLM